jgi:hypothetical protein
MASPKIIPKKSIIASKVPTISDLQPGEICLNYADAKIYGRHPGNNTIVTFASGSDGGGGPVGTAVDLDAMFSTAFENYYHTLNYSGSGDLTSIQVHDDAVGTTLLFTRSYSYDGSGNLVTVTTTDEQNAGVSLTKTISYNGSGDIATMTRFYSL